MLKRKIEEKLLQWKNTSERKPLIIKGCRQCGKTYSVMKFAKDNYEHVVYFFWIIRCGKYNDDDFCFAWSKGCV